VDAGDDQAGNVGDIADMVRPDLLGDLPEDLEVDGTRIGGGPEMMTLGRCFLARSRILS